jgi:putative aldouronate transport system substrate-binding protein
LKTSVEERCFGSLLWPGWPCCCRPVVSRILNRYLSYPANPPRATQETPGRGSEVSFFVSAYYPPATPLDQNPAWQEVNKQLDTTVNFHIVPMAEVELK